MTKLIKSFPPIYFLLWLIKGRRKKSKDEIWRDAHAGIVEGLHKSKDASIAPRVAPKSKPPKTGAEKITALIRSTSIDPIKPYIETEQTREPFKTKPPFEKPKEKK